MHGGVSVATFMLVTVAVAVAVIVVAPAPVVGETVATKDIAADQVKSLENMLSKTLMRPI